MAWRTIEGERAWKRAYMRAYNAELRRRGLCVQCTRISVRFRMCLTCRRRKRTLLAWRQRLADRIAA